MSRITIEIGSTSREWHSLDEVDESWIAQQITERERAGQPFCVKIGISDSTVNVGMQVGQCQGGFPSGSRPNEDEERIIQLWRDRVKSNGHIDPGQIIAFFKQLRRYL